MPACLLALHLQVRLNSTGDPKNMRDISIDETQSICGHIFFLGDAQSNGKLTRRPSLVKAPVKQKLKPLMMHLLDSSIPTNIYDDNCG
jgi:hypothetical protein